jgi:DNA polymerase-1
LDHTIGTNNWGVDQHGASLLINDTSSGINSGPLFIDIETDEKDNFVGAGYTQDGTKVYFSSDLGTVGMHIRTYLNQNGSGLVGFNLKFDAKLLAKWGIPIQSDNLKDDVQLMSYALNATKESHSLKSLGKEHGFEWPTYKELVGSGRKKVTLDKQPIELVAKYCGMDVLVTYKLYDAFKRKMDALATRIYNQIEMPLMRILFEMELQGVLIDVKKLIETDQYLAERIRMCQCSLERLAGRPINPNSNKQVAEILNAKNYSLPQTEKGNFKVDKFTLEKYKEDEFVKVLLEYNKLEKLYNTYTQGMLERTTLPRIFTTYNQVTTTNAGSRGISTGRLSSSNPNIQQIPTRTQEGELLRAIFIPREGHVFVDADYSQIEYRLLAHFTKEPVLLKAFMEGKDVHEETGKALGVDRDTGKTLNFAAIYGAQAKKIAQTAKCFADEAQGFLDKYWKVLPRVTSWINRVKYEARQKKGIYTLQKRWIPIPEINTNDLYERYHWERTAVNYIVQGSAAEIMKLAMIELRKKGLLPVLTVHDELLFEAPFDMVDLYKHTVKQTMEKVVKIDVPLVVDVGTGSDWKEAKNG